MQCATMSRRTLTMNWDGLEDDDNFFETYDRLSSAVPLDLASSGSDDEFEDGRMSFASALSSASIKRLHSIQSIARPSSSCILGGYDRWMSEPGDINERRKRLLQGMGLTSNKNILTIASSKVVRAISKKTETPQILISSVDSSSVDSSSSPIDEESNKDYPSQTTHVVLVRSRSDGDIDAFSAKTKQRKEELVGPVSKQRLTRTSSGQLVRTIGVCKMSPGRVRKRLSAPNNDLLQSVMSDEAFGSFFLIKNLDTGKEFIVKEYNEEGMWNKLSDVQTGKQLTMEEFEKSVGYSPVVKELMRRQENGRKVNHQNSILAKSFRNSKRMGAAILKNLTSMSGLKAEKEQENSSQVVEKGPNKNTSQWVKARQNGKTYKEFTALHMSQEIQAHEGSIWTIRFSCDARYLASAGEDRLIHVWEVQECDVMSMRSVPSVDDLSSCGGTPVHPMAGIASDRPPLAEITPLPSEMRKKGRNNKKKGNSIPDYVNVPETVFALSEKPICTFEGHQEDVLDLSWSRAQLLLSSSMDKTVRLWDLETKSCLKMFAHNDYVTCIQFNPVDDDYFISGSLDAKVRLWNVPARKVVDWTDIREMVTAACYTPDGQGAVIGSHQGSCHMYDIDDGKLEHRMDIQIKKKAQVSIIPGFQSQAKVQAQSEKITGLQFDPSNPSELLVTSASSRILIYNESELVQKFTGFRNTSSQISASYTPNGSHVISASEDSQVYIWKVEETKNQGGGKGKSKITVYANEHFQCKDVSVAIPWPGSIRSEPPPIVEIHSKRHSKRSQQSNGNSAREDNLVDASSRRHLPPLPKKNNNVLERITSSADEDIGDSSRIDPGIGVSESFCSSPAISYDDSPSISASETSPSQSWSSSWSLFDNGNNANGGQALQATAWGMVIVTASLEGEIRIYQNFGLPLKVGRQAHLF